MDAMELLKGRASNNKLGEPAPDDAALREILTAALRAPDHAALRPWKILLVRGDARAKLGEIFARIEKENGGDDAEVERARNKPLRAPLVIIVLAIPRENPKAPEIEQVLSAGAVAHGILLGLEAKGFAGSWRTGDVSYDAHFKEALGVRESDHVIAILYAGTATSPAPDAKRPSYDDFVVDWQG
jgi:nitroreductase